MARKKEIFSTQVMDLLTVVELAKLMFPINVPDFTLTELTTAVQPLV